MVLIKNINFVHYNNYKISGMVLNILRDSTIMIIKVIFKIIMLLQNFSKYIKK